jgi:hypothetical protein
MHEPLPPDPQLAASARNPESPAAPHSEDLRGARTSGAFRSLKILEQRQSLLMTTHLLATIAGPLEPCSPGFLRK